MRILILTTQTSHHAYFVRALAQEFADLHVLVERTGVRPVFETAHAFEVEREGFERDLWFDGSDVQLTTLAATSTFQNINEAAAVDFMTRFRPMVTIDFGTRKLLMPTIQAAGGNILNLHGGDPQQYRGLDCHLWAIYHEDFANLVTTLHFLNEKLDDGAIVGMCPIDLERGLKLYQLRARNTDCALRLTRQALREVTETGSLASRPQAQLGRYYSFMPAVLKSVCVEKFERYSAGLR